MNSLVTPLVRRIVLVSTLGVCVAALVAPLVDRPSPSVVSPHLQSLLEGSLSKAADGHLVIVPTPDLDRYRQERPNLRFAVGDPQTGRVVPGSSLPAVFPLQQLMRAGLSYSSVYTDVDAIRLISPNGYLMKRQTRWGALTFYIQNDRYSFLDWWERYLAAVGESLLFWGPVIIVMSWLAIRFIRRALAPVVRVARETASIDINSLNQRIRTEDLPLEILPMAEAMNAALARIDDDVLRQRRFIADAAHELRTPAALLKARVDSLEDGSARRELRRDVRRLTMLIDQLLTSARINAVGLSLHEEIDLFELARDIVADHAPLAIENGRQIELVAPDEVIAIRGNRRAIASAIANLIDNAVRAEPPQGVVQVLIEPGAVVSVIDRGEGVPPEDCKLIFAPFWRRDDRSSGAGLGLAIVKEVAAVHRGEIAVKETPGGGATFRLSLPQARSA